MRNMIFFRAVAVGFLCSLALGDCKALSPPKTAPCDYSGFHPLRGSFDPRPGDEIAKPVYPEEARKQGIQGKVIVRVLVNQDGVVTRACVRKGHRLLREASIDAALRSRYLPVLINDRPDREANRF